MEHQDRSRRLVASALAVLVVVTVVPSESAWGGPDRDGSSGSVLDRVEGLTLEQVGSGELLWRSERGLIPLPIVGIDVELSVTGIMVHGRVTQRFHNPTDRVIEAIYVFPLPDRAAVHSMEMRIGDRRILSEIQERQRARETYERAKQTGRKAALVEQHRPNLFTTHAANLKPGESIEVVLEYHEEVSYRSGRFGLRFPLTYTPRFVPGHGTRSPESDAGLDGPFVSSDRASAPRAEVRVEIRAGFPIAGLRSVSHEVEIESPGDGRVVRTPSGGVAADRDFLLEWEPEPTDRPRSTAFVEETEFGRFALLLMIPPAPVGEVGLGLPTETLFIVDVSGSMDGPSIRQARRALLAALDRLRPGDRFNLLEFNDDHQSFRPGFEPAEPATLDAAREWVRGLRASGGTMIHPALVHGLAMAGNSRGSERVQRIVFLTDGAVGNEQEVLRSIRERVGEIRIHAIGLGQAPNAYLMRKIASFGHGLCEFIPRTDLADNRIDAFFRKLDRPVLGGPVLDWDEVEIEEAHPVRLPDLHSGEPLFVSASLGRGDLRGNVTLAGATRAGWIETSVEITSAERGSGIAVRWARAKVESLMDDLHEGADPGTVRSQVIDLALAHNLVTAYTSLVAVEEVPSSFGPAEFVRLASALPQGGTLDPLRRILGVVLVLCGGSLFVVATRRRAA